MTKVNYFQVTGTLEQTGEEQKVVTYARSKRESVELAEQLHPGIKIEDTKEGVIELNFKERLQEQYTPRDLLDIRTECKKLWKNMSNTKELKSKVRKSNEE